jgi:uncharacterized protein YndB with AHSA1/START domain
MTETKTSPAARAAESGAARSVVVEREMPHPPQKVWRAITQQPLVEEWLMKNDIEAVVGRRFAFRAQPMPQWDGVIHCEMLAVEPPTKLVYSWVSMGVETLVTWTLTPTASGTNVRMEQSGFGEGQEQNLRGAEFGWRRFVDGLARVLGGMGEG